MCIRDRLTVFRKTESRTFPVTIVREEIRMQSVRAKMVDPGYGWLRVSQFQDRTVDDFVKKIEELYKQDPNLKGLVLDLRNDPGGLLEGAIAISAAFLPADVTVVSTNGQLPESKQIFKARIIRQRKECRRPDGLRVKFEDNAAVIVDDEGVPKGSEVKGPVAREVAERFSKVASAASIIV